MSQSEFPTRHRDHSTSPTPKSDSKVKEAQAVDAAAPKYTHRQLTRWMFKVTRPVLAPLLASSAARVADQMLGVIMLAYCGWQLGLRLTGLPHASLGRVVLVLGGIALVKAFLRYLEQFTGHFVAFKALELLRREAYEHLYPQAPALTRSARAGDLLVRVTRDIDRIEVFFAHTFAPAVSAVLVPILTSLLAWYWGAGILALLILACYAASLAVILLLDLGSARRAANQTLQVRSGIVTQVSDIIGGNREIRGYELQDDFFKKQQQAEVELAKVTAPTHLVLGLRRGVTFGAVIGMTVLLTLVGFSQVRAGQLTLPVVLAVAAGAFRGWESVRGVEDFSTFLTQSFASAARLLELTSGKPVPEGGTRPLPEGQLQFSAQDVDFYYEDATGQAHQALKQVSMDVPAGQWHALVGPTGCGKSTLATLFARYTDPQAGQLLVGGQDLRETQVDALRSAVVYVPQRAHLFNDTIADNLRLAAPEASEPELWRALEIAQVAEEVRQMPQGLETMVGEKGTAVSGGQRQRLAIARAVLMNPRAVILDESTAHLNDELAAQVRRQLREALPQATILEITHRISQLEGVQTVWVMDQGQIVQSGKPSELAQQPGVFGSLLSRA
ncbi:amino acid ABC transporter ATP-binding/permease protein [Boudabousia liubingyangii]|uniref:amino acid ABC transporter ATP-binding/permease protein n=1 Tax=Boudabousia liubingyangii TaxID=1921764 RepID=UPI0009FB0FC7|nr:ABC transporter ATP-binding protein [Boudabousia liubingyangii]